MEFLEVLTEGLNRVLLVRGGGREVITIYSWKNSLHQPTKPTPSLTPAKCLIHIASPKTFPYHTQAISQNSLSLSDPNPKMELLLLFLPHEGPFYSFSMQFSHWPPHVLGLLAFFVVCDPMIYDLPCRVQCHIWYEEKLLMSVRFLLHSWRFLQPLLFPSNQETFEKLQK